MTLIVLLIHMWFGFEFSSVSIPKSLTDLIAGEKLWHPEAFPVLIVATLIAKLTRSVVVVDQSYLPWGIVQAVAN